MIWLLIGYMWLFIHRPFEVWPWLAGYRIERVYMLATLLYWAFLAEKKLIPNRLHGAFALMSLAIIASALLSQYVSITDVTVQNWFKIAVFYVLVVTSVRSERHLQMLIAAFVACFGLYMLHSLWEFHCGRFIYRMGIPRMIGVDRTFSDPNTFGASIVYALPMAAPLWAVASRKWHYRALVGYVGLAILCIMLTGSRSSFVALGALAVVAAWQTRYRKLAFIALLLAAPVVWINLSDDLQDRYMSIIDPSRGGKGAEASASGRMDGFVRGLSVWSEHPVLGVGPHGFGHATGRGTQTHNLYGQVASELGTVGILALLAIIGGFTLNMREAWWLAQANPKLKETFCYKTCLATFITIGMLLLLGWGGHNLFRYTWLWYAAFQVASIYFLKQQAYSESLSDDELGSFEDSEDSHFGMSPG